MKCTIETTENGCIENITFNDGTQYSKRHTKMDGISEEILDKVYDLFDAFLASEFMDIAELLIKQA